ncbi:MAG: hypothetical protein EAZ55_07410 [Cytophagales bacterium]|nr:MAG: hypothetical protein EAZ55_07410 [Cytophagales bacterium]
MKALLENGNQITLLDKNEIKRGGEGKILTIPELPQQVAKIYLNTQLKHMSKAQIKALAILDSQYFVKPLTMIYDAKKNDIIGFTMEYIPQNYMPLAAFFNRNTCLQYQIDDKLKTEIAQQMIQAIAQAHQNDIIIGDLSGLNILVNLQGNIKFIDVDAYETPIHTHSGILLDEIRDYLYQGKVSCESDFFALAVVLFNLFTHLHPFKGIHAQYKSLAERMVHKISVLSGDNQLIIPKCYTPMQQPYLLDQFEQIFQQGKRFLLSLQQPIVTATKTSAALTTITTAQLTIKIILQSQKQEIIQQVSATQKRVLITTNQNYYVYDSSNKGYLQAIQTFAKTEYQKVWVGEKNIIGLKKQKLYQLHPDKTETPINNLQGTFEEQNYKQINQTLVLIEEDYMKWVFIDDIIKDQIRIEQTMVFGKGFDVFGGLIQNAGGMQYVFYHSGKNISTVKSTQMLHQVFIAGQVGIGTYSETKQGETSLKNAYFDIQNLQTQWSAIELTRPKHIAYRATNAQEGIVFEPADDALLIRKSKDFQLIQKSDCPVLSDESVLFSTLSGIVALEKGNCYLINSQ